MSLKKNISKVKDKFQKESQSIGKKASEIFHNVASHLPFSNISKKDDNCFFIELDFPGIAKKDIDINIKDNILTVSAIRNYKKDLTKDDYYIHESTYGKIERSFVLSNDINTDKIEAELSNGRLEISLESSKKKKKSITIKE